MSTPALGTPRPGVDAVAGRSEAADEELVEPGVAPGRLRVYLGAAPGVGKTYAMLDEARRRLDRGTDLVVGVADARGRVHTAEMLDGLEVVAPRTVTTAPGQAVSELDLEAVLRRRPAVVAIDDLAHTNAPGSVHGKRWQDVVVLLDFGIDVITTVNIDQLDSLRDAAADITHERQPHTVPDEVLRRAEQVELVDMTPEALRRRLSHGNVFGREGGDWREQRYFDVESLAALRELALLWMADVVEDSLQRRRRGAGQEHVDEMRDRVVVAVTGAASGEQVIRRAAHIAQRARADLVGVHVLSAEQSSGHPRRTRSSRLAAHQQLLVDLGGEYHDVRGTEVGHALVRFAEGERATQLVVGAARRSRLAELVRGSVVHTVLREAGQIDVHVVSAVVDRDPETSSLTRRRLPHLSGRRQLAGWLLVAIGLPLISAVLLTFRGHFNLASDMLVYLLLVTAVAVVGGIRPSMAAAVGSSLILNVLLTDPIGVWTFSNAQEFVALVAFVVVGSVVSVLVSLLSRRSVEAIQARAEAEALARVAGGMASGDSGLEEMVVSLAATFGMRRVAVLEPSAPAALGAPASWRTLVSTGSPALTSPDGHPTLPLAEGGKLVYDGPTLNAEDRRVLRAFVTQLDAGLERRRLQARAAQASALAQADRLRTAILRAVSHDLRTPLASIKASATSLLQDDIVWPDDARHEFLSTIDEETDRLNVLVGNLLDMSRIETGAIDVTLRPVGLDEIVPQALHSLSGPRPDVVLVLPDTMPAVLADPALLERVVANLTANALRHAPADQPVRIEVGERKELVDLRIVDRGCGVPVAERERLFEPFQRLGDQPNGTGVGLGLAVARGFVDAMHGELVLEDTPGGGLTAVVSLPRAS
jgi:two-component system sensor histidine kinase KdpD